MPPHTTNISMSVSEIKNLTFYNIVLPDLCCISMQNILRDLIENSIFLTSECKLFSLYIIIYILALYSSQYKNKSSTERISFKVLLASLKLLLVADLHLFNIS